MPEAASKKDRWRTALRLLALLGWWSFAQVAFGAGSVAVTEERFKAGLLVKFTQYTIWPTNEIASSNAPIVIGVLGADPLGKELDREAAGVAGPHPIEVRRITTAAAAAQCQVVFISKAESRNEAQWLAELKDKPILTVGESGQTLARGGLLEFVTVEKGIKFDVNKSGATQARLRILSPMLVAARKVHDSTSSTRQ